MGWVKLTAKEAAAPPKTILCHKLALVVGATGAETDMLLNQREEYYCCCLLLVLQERRWLWNQLKNKSQMMWKTWSEDGYDSTLVVVVRVRNSRKAAAAVWNANRERRKCRRKFWIPQDSLLPGFLKTLEKQQQ